MHENVHLGDQQTQDFLVGDYTFKKLTKDPKGKALTKFGLNIEIQRNQFITFFPIFLKKSVMKIA